MSQNRITILLLSLLFVVTGCAKPGEEGANNPDTEKEEEEHSTLDSREGWSHSLPTLPLTIFPLPRQCITEGKYFTTFYYIAHTA